MEKVFTVNNDWIYDDYIDIKNAGIKNLRINGIHLTEEALDILLSFNHKGNFTIFYDLPGIKWRIWSKNKQRIYVKADDMIIIREERGDEKENSLYDFTVTGQKFWDNIQRGDILIIRRINSQNVKIVITDCGDKVLSAKVVSGGVIGYGYHILNPDRYIMNNKLSVDDLEQDFRIRKILPDIIAVSFADCKEVIYEAKERWGDISQIYAKIESPEAIRNIPEILNVSDGIIIGRDDLSAFYSEDQIKEIVSDILIIVHNSHKPCIGASNYLQNVYERGYYTDKDISDVFMLLSNSAKGIYINETNKDSNWKKYLKAINEIFERAETLVVGGN